MRNIKITINKTEGGYLAICKQLNMISGGSTFTGVLDGFISDFKYFKQHYAALPDDKCTDAVIKIKRIYRRLS